MVHAAHGETTSIGKGTVNIPIDGGIIQEAYSAPGVSSHIISADLPSAHFEVVMPSSLKTEKGCYLFKKGSCAVDEIVWQRPVVHGLYRISMATPEQYHKTYKIASKDVDMCKEWHDRIRHM